MNNTNTTVARKSGQDRMFEKREGKEVKRGPEME